MNNLLELLGVVRSKDYVVLDTETTGINDAEIVEISILGHDGSVLLDTLIKPSVEIPQEATNIHGITNEMVKDSPKWSEMIEEVSKAIYGKHLIIYNKAYDTRIMNYVTAKSNTEKTWDTSKSIVCAMLAYSEYKGETKENGKGLKWHKLTDATKAINLEVTNAHRALGDCIMTRLLVEYIFTNSSKLKVPRYKKYSF